MSTVNKRSFVHRKLATPSLIRSPLRPVGDFASIDFETQGARSLKDVGAHKYMEDPWFRPICFQWAMNQEPPELWIRGQPLPKTLMRHIARGGMLHAWNAQFERLVWATSIMQTYPNYVPVPIGQWRCTMVRSLACGFPGKLEEAAIALRLPERKDTSGGKTMLKLSKPRNMGRIKKGIDTEPVWWEADDQHGPLHKVTYEYCGQDVITEREAGNYLPLLQPEEEREWRYDQIVSDRGVFIDQTLCVAAIKIAEARKAELAVECIQLTGYNPTQLAKIKEWAEDTHGVTITSLDQKSGNVARLLADESVHDDVKRFLHIRGEAGMASTSKYASALAHLCADGTVKGTRQFYGAHTGRWAGRGVQYDNMPRPTMKGDIDEVVDVVLTGDHNIVESIYGNVMEPVQNCIRSMLTATARTLETDDDFIGEAQRYVRSMRDDEEDFLGIGLENIEAEPDHHLYVADLKSIESRMLALLSGQESVLRQWRLSDQGKGPDVYVMNAARMFGVSLKEAAHKDKRQYGKIAELSLGYEGGTGSLLRQTKSGAVQFSEIYSVLYKKADDATRSKVQFLWNLMGKSDEASGITEKDWRAARFIVERWRQDNPMSVKFWRMIRLASVKAVKTPGVPSSYRGITFIYDKPSQYLFCRLMSGRELKYPFAHVVVAKNHKNEDELQLRCEYFHTKLRKMVKYHPYGGFMTENIDQAQSRDAFKDRFPALEKAGFKLLHTVHDEGITKNKIGLLNDFIRTFAVSPKWAPTLPVAVEAWSGPRYKKAD